MVKQTIKASLRAEETNVPPRTHVLSYGKTNSIHFHSIKETHYVSN